MLSETRCNPSVQSRYQSGVSPTNRQFGACAVWQFDQVAGFGVGRVPGTPQHFHNLLIQRVVGMRHMDHAVIV